MDHVYDTEVSPDARNRNALRSGPWSTLQDAKARARALFRAA